MTRRTCQRAVPWRMPTGFALAVLLLVPSVARAQLVVGRVVDDLTDAPVAATSVLLVDSLATVAGSVLSDDDGRFILRAPGGGVFRIYADHLGYGEVTSGLFVVPESGSFALEVRLTPNPFELDSLVVTARARQAKLHRHGFYRRRTSGIAGYFFDSGDITEQHPLALSDLLRLVPAVQLRATPRGGTAIISRRTLNMSLYNPICRMKVVLDGFVRQVLDDESVDDLVDIGLVAGVEVYPSVGGVGAPPEYRGPDANCGVVMIWTR